MRYVSVCSGIEAATVSWHGLGWSPVAFSEIEPFPCKVLAHHYPDVPNLGDMTKYKEWKIERPNLLVGGTPCQSFSIAGLRKGLDDPRGNLMLTYLGIADAFKPEWIVWENVPGVLSSNGGRDFGTFLQGLAQLGYGFAYRVLDAQYVRTHEFYGAVPQRRRRVFVVGHLGDWRRAAAVLFDSESMRGNPPPRREAGKGFTHAVAPCLAACGRGTERIGDTRRQDAVIAVTGRVTHSLRAEGCDASEDGTGRGTPIICMSHGQANDRAAPTLNAAFGQKLGLDNQHIDSGAGLFVFDDPIALVGNAIDRQPHTGGNGPGLVKSGAMYTLTKTDIHAVCAPIPFDTTQITSPENGCNPKPNVPCHSLARGAHAPAIAFQGDATPKSFDNVAGTMRRDQGGEGDTVAFASNSRMQVRRLTPLECERLQGFPDQYTNIPGASDTARYKALGNSMACNVMQIIGQRIAMVDAL